MVNIPIGAEDQFEGVIDLLDRKALYFDGASGEVVRTAEIPDGYADKVEEWRSKLVEACADFDDAIMEKFLDGTEVTAEELAPVIRKATIELKFVPTYCGSAYKNKAVQPMLDGVTRFLPDPTEVVNKAFERVGTTESEVVLETKNDLPMCSLAFKLEDGRFGQLTYLRIYQGKVAKGDTIYNARTQQKNKVGRLVRMHADKMEEIDEATAGDICALFGIDCAAGDTFTDGEKAYSLRSMFVPEAVIFYSIKPKDNALLSNFSKALNRFSKEDPTFKVRRDEESAETIIAGMGELHLEVYIERMRREYKVDTIVGEPQVAYRETIGKEVNYEYIHRKQTGGSGQFAKIAGVMRPLPDPQPGEHYRFLDKIVGGIIPREFIPSVDHGFQIAKDRGVLIGFPVVDIEMELNDGSYHQVDSSDIAFQIAARAAFKEAMRKADPVVLEPMMRVEVETPEEFQGAVQTTLIRRRGVIIGSEGRAGSNAVEALVPLAEMFAYSNELRSATQGKAEYTMEFERYAPVPKSIQEGLMTKYKDRPKG